MYAPGSTWKSHIRSAVELRHELHRSPELTWQEYRTAERIRRVLTDMGVLWMECAGTGTVATLAGQAPGRHIALRADIDALPIDEQADVPWHSEIPGRMHACGHDGHTAVLIAAASWLKQHEAQLPGPVTLLFQPAEEGGHGARAMIEAGALQGCGCPRRVDFVYGWHNWPAIPFGRAACPDGAVMAANGTFGIDISGTGGHSSQPELCRDPLLAAAAVIQNLQQIVSRRTAPQTATVVSVTSCDAPSMPTVIRDQVRLEGSIRTADTTQREEVFRQIEAIAVSTAESFGTTAQVELVPRYGATVNHPEAAGHARDALTQVLGPQALGSTVALPVMASEDFSYYLAEIPGAFMLLGASQDERYRAACHNPSYEFNDSLVGTMLEVYARLAGAPSG